MNKKPLIDEDGEMREVTVADLKKFRPATEMLPAAALALFVDGPKAAVGDWIDTHRRK